MARVHAGLHGEAASPGAFGVNWRMNSTKERTMAKKGKGKGKGEKDDVIDAEFREEKK